ncbi:hypothetical protein JM83_0921 [Gillisia sp. Hel_I_86]|nr:hypothetical protein JM83_0921 [Gillisia sp. Hel_I_86]
MDFEYFVIPTLGGISGYIDSVLLRFFSPLRFLQNDNPFLLSSRPMKDLLSDPSTGYIRGNF